MNKSRRDEARRVRDETEAITQEKAREDRLKDRESRLAAREEAIFKKMEDEAKEKERAERDRENRARRRLEGEIVDSDDERARSVANGPTGRRSGREPKTAGPSEPKESWELNCEVCRMVGWNLVCPLCHTKLSLLRLTACAG